jgi:hypothetical protein
VCVLGFLKRDNSCCTEAFVMKFGGDVPISVVIPGSVYMFILELLVRSCACFYEVLSAAVRI